MKTNEVIAVTVGMLGVADIVLGVIVDAWYIVAIGIAVIAGAVWAWRTVRHINRTIDAYLQERNNHASVD